MLMTAPFNRRARRGRTRALAVAVAVLGSLAAPAAWAADSPVPAGKAVPKTKTDFNGDGFEDDVTAAPTGTVNGVKFAGYLAVIYGSGKAKPSQGRKQIIHQDSPGVIDKVEKYDGF